MCNMSVELLDHMGTDLTPVNAARVSMNKGSTLDNHGQLRSQDAKLIHYLAEHKHCYTAGMQVLTYDGWKNWEHCSEEETYLVPNPTTRRLTPEKLKLEVFDCDEEVFSFKNERMSYSVTAGHRMFFKSKNGDGKYKIYPVEDKPNWGHFDSSIGYKLHDQEPSPFGKLVGFYLGDGFKESGITGAFRLKKPRKVEYIKEVLKDCKIQYRERKTLDNATLVSFHYTAEFERLVNKELKTRDKQLAIPAKDLAGDVAAGIFDGLLNSDGSVSQHKRTTHISFSSTSPHLLKLFESLSTMLGRDCHYSTVSINSFGENSRTTLESRAQYHSKEYYKGKVYCTTTSTGLLVVRGNPDEFGFICGNTSCFEHQVASFRLKVPIFVARQIQRHRTFTYSEVSRRYVKDDLEFYWPDKWRKAAANIKQGSSDEAADDQRQINYHAQNACHGALLAYKDMLAQDVAPELARMILPQNLMTTFYMTGSLRNWAHFLKLRLDSHAQQEAREVAQMINDVLVELWPISMKELMK